MMDVLALSARWPIAQPLHATPLAGGYNNQTWRIETMDEQHYVLRIKSDGEQFPRIEYEAKLLYALQECKLPFHLPIPLKTSDGKSFISSEQAANRPRIATLHPFLPGHTPDRNDSTLAATAGVALAALDTALTTLPDMQPDEHEKAFTSFDGFVHVHPLVTDPIVDLERIKVDSDQRRQFQAILEWANEQVERLYSRLPQQLLHRDYDPGNIFVDDHQVTAVFDFEFAGTDLRILDLCVALRWWPVQALGTGKAWEIIDAFGSAYTAQFPLNEEELRAIPDVLRIREMSSFMHRLGRYFAGLEGEEVIPQRIESALRREQWLQANQDMLVEHALAWNKRKE